MCHMTFREKVLDLTGRIPEGKVTTYSELAKALGSPKAARSVGNALNKNLHPIVIPCHRVIKSTGEIGGYSRGQDIKIALLKKEGIPVKDRKVISHEKYLYRFNKQTSPKSS